MALRLTQLDETNRSAFEALLAHAWEQNWGPDLARELIRWRYHERVSGGGTWLAFNDGQCVAMLDSFRRPYLLDGRRILVREACDWYCLPKYRPLGLGVRLMRAMMACPEPMVAIGGSDATLAMLPRLGWKKLPNTQRYVLPIKARSLAGALLRNRWPAGEAYAKAVPAFVRLRRPSAPCPPAIGAAQVIEGRSPESMAQPAAEGRGLVQLLDPAVHDWMARMPPDVAQTLSLAFFLDDALVASSLSRIEPAATGFDGCIVHLQIARPLQAVADWVVAETASRLAERGVGLIRCLASSPRKQAALRKAGFSVRAPLASYWWPKPDFPTPVETDVGYLRADDAVPLPALRGRHLARAQRPASAASVGSDQHVGCGLGADLRR
jgi:hypothetical protein